MYQTQPHLFEQPESREKWLEATIKKIEQTENKLTEVKQSGEDKNKKVKRLEQKIDNLNLIKKLMEERTTFEDSLKAGFRWYDRLKEDKATQTEEIVETDKTIEMPGS